MSVRDIIPAIQKLIVIIPGEASSALAKKAIKEMASIVV